MSFNEKISNLLLNNTVVMFIIFLFLLKPSIIIANNTLNLLFKVVGLILLFIIILLYLCQQKISKIQIAIFIYVGCLGISTFFGTKDFNTFAINYGVIIGVSLYTEMVINNNLEKFLKSISALISVYIILNLLTVLFTNGIGEGMLRNYYFLGYDNASVHIIVLGLFIMIISSYYFHKKITPFVFIMIILGFLTYYLEWAASCLVSIVLLIFYVLFIYKKKFFKKFLKFNALFIISFLLFLLLVVFRKQELFSYVIVNILHKDLTITGRLVIWDRALFQIQNNLILGLGIQNETERLLTLGIYHAHSTFLNVLLEGGIVAFVAFLNIFRVATKNLVSKTKKRNEFTYICIFSLFIYLVSTLVDVIMDDYIFYVFLNICYFLPLIINKFDTKWSLENNKQNIVK